ncbi:hypothetical protein GGF43_005872, partial [Coemansia sp. RSA 2618]
MSQEEQQQPSEGRSRRRQANDSRSDSSQPPSALGDGANELLSESKDQSTLTGQAPAVTTAPEIIRYTIDELMAVRQSKLVYEPDDFSPITPL